MPLTPDEIAANLPALLGLRDELDQLIEAHQRARNDGKVTPAERQRIGRKARKLVKAALPVLMSIALDVAD